MKRLTEVLQNKYKNYIFPFLWLHGEDEEILRDYVRKIYESGIKALCIEARPHPDFLGNKWWKDVDAIMDEAKKHNMKVWLLDDSHFPTGFANGRVKKDFPQYQKKYLKIHQLDFAGPLDEASLLIKWGSPQTKFVLNQKAIPHQDNILKIIAAKRTGSSSVDPDTLIDITEHQKNNFLNWNIPDGQWRIFVLIETYGGGEPHTEGYLNPLVAEATQILINEVYEPHYQHYKDEFGKTFAGFFSDEPRFGNMHGAEGSIGRTEMVYPWRDGMLEEFFTNDYLYLPLLEPITANGKEKEIRLKYMNIVSEEYRKNFTAVLAGWCHERNVEYIGHLIEDNNAHARLGYGAGHYFRAIEPQDMAGIDVVLNQIMPGMDEHINKSMTRIGWDGEFFHYGLGKMGASLGHLDPKKKGRTMCEVYGAYGWAEGLNLMKFIADHMLVRGVNHFVPHAFSPKTFPDPDCPPHFYAHGHNPEFRYMKILNEYMNRISHLMNGGKHFTKVAVLYHAEAEWLGEYMLFQKPAKVLMQNQIDFDIVPIDYVLSSSIEKDKFVIHNEVFETLIIPYAEALPKEFLNKLEELNNNGISIYFIDDFPTYNENNDRLNEKLFVGTSKVSLEDLADALKAHGTEFAVKTNEPYLRYYHYQQDDGNICMFVNEHPYKEIKTEASLKVNQTLVKYDALKNELYEFEQIRDGNQVKFSIYLYPFESLILVSDIGESQLLKDLNLVEGKYLPLDLTWKVGFATAEQYPNFKDQMEIKNLMNVSRLEGIETFSGNIKYTTTFEMKQENGRVVLDLGMVNEVAEVFINDQSVGARICAPYQFEITDYIKEGINKLEVIVVDNLGKQEQDYLSQYIPMRPTGLLGPVKIFQVQK